MATPAVVFGEGRRPEASTLVQMESFDGPLGLLLSLIEGRQLDVLTVPLGGIADAYLDALAGLDGDRIGNVSSFVAIASQLILIKSRAMLPRQAEAGTALEEGPDPEAELRARLLLYKAYRDAGARLQEEAGRRYGLFRREPSVALAAAFAGARPPEGPPLDPRVLVAALDGLAKITPPPEPPPEVMGRAVTLADRAAIIRSALGRATPSCSRTCCAVSATALLSRSRSWRCSSS
jgi:segregation and condensation protein A